MYIKLIDETTCRMAPGMMILGLWVGTRTQCFGQDGHAAVLALIGWTMAWFTAPRTATVFAMGLGAWVIGNFVGASLL
jgi:hypothetical protein